MEYLHSETFENFFKEKININDAELSRIKQLLRDTQSIIAGGAVLRAYNNYIENNRGFTSIDFDTYVHFDQAKNFIDGIQNILLNSCTFVYESSYVTPPYDGSFLKKNNILGRFMLMLSSRGQFASYAYFDILVVSNEKPLVDVVNSFDLSFCKIWYDGTNVISMDREGLLNKTGELGEDYVKSFLDGNKYTIERVKKYKERGYKIKVKLNNPYIIKKKENNTISSPQDWVLRNVVKFIVFNDQNILMLSLFELEPFYRFVKLNTNSISDLINSLEANEISREDIKKIFVLAFYKTYNYYSEEYKEYIRLVLEEYFGPIDIEEYFNEFHDDDDDNDDDHDHDDNFAEVALLPPAPAPILAPAPVPVRPRSQILGELEAFEFDSQDIDERTFDFTTCKDIILDENQDIAEYLSETDTFLFINGNPNELGSNIICFSKDYLRQFIQNKDDNWFYECDGLLLPSGDRSMSSFVDYPYLKIFINDEGLLGFIPLIQIRKILVSEYRVYYINPLLDENGNQKMITHTVTWQNSYGPRLNMNYQSANHCQRGSNILIYTLKVCRDPERCILSIMT
jgi:hypothetical protein